MPLETKIGTSKVFRATSALFVCGVLYALILAFGNSPGADMIGTILFLFVSTALYVHLSMKEDPTVSARPSSIAMVTLAIPMGVAIAASLVGQGESFFWVADSTGTHLPGAMNLANWLTQGTDVAFDGPLQSRGFLTHFWVALFISVFGAKAWVTVLALAILKIATCYLIVRIAEELFGTSKFAPAYVVYLLAPTVLWHTLAFYKEAAVHFSVALTLYGLISMHRKVAVWKAIALACGIICLAYERFYLVAFILPLIAVFILLALKARRIQTVIALILGAIGFYWIYPYFKLSPSEAIAHLRELRRVHSSFTDINYKMNYEIPFVLAVVKSFLTPIWSPEKITMFRGPSAILTWGSFIHQFIIVSYFLGVVRAIRTRGYIHAAIQLPFFLFILAVAYVSPWAGRIRDSFYPLIAIYAFFYWKNFLMDDVRWITQKIRRRQT